MAPRRRARIDAEIDHRGATSLRLRFLNAEAPGIPMSYLRASSDTVEYDREPRKVGYDEAIPSGQWLFGTSSRVYLRRRDMSRDRYF